MLNKAIQQAVNLGQYAPPLALPSSPTPRFSRPGGEGGDRGGVENGIEHQQQQLQLTHADRARISSLIGLIYMTPSLRSPKGDLVKAQAAYVESLKFWDEDFKSDYPFALNDFEVKAVEKLRDVVRLEIEKRQRQVAGRCACLIM